MLFGVGADVEHEFDCFVVHAENGTDNLGCSFVEPRGGIEGTVPIGLEFGVLCLLLELNQSLGFFKMHRLVEIDMNKIKKLRDTDHFSCLLK